MSTTENLHCGENVATCRQMDASSTVNDTTLAISITDLQDQMASLHNNAHLVASNVDPLAKISDDEDKKHHMTIIQAKQHTTTEKKEPPKNADDDDAHRDSDGDSGEDSDVETKQTWWYQECESDDEDTIDPWDRRSHRPKCANLNKDVLSLLNQAIKWDMMLSWSWRDAPNDLRNICHRGGDEDAVSFVPGEYGLEPTGLQHNGHTTTFKLGLSSYGSRTLSSVFGHLVVCTHS